MGLNKITLFFVWLVFSGLFGQLLYAQIPDSIFNEQSVKVKIDGEKEGFLTIPQSALPNPPPRFLLFVRSEEGKGEIVGRGIIMAVQDGKYLIELDRESVLKLPIPGDYAVPMGAPRDFPPLPELNMGGNTPNVQEEILPDDKGWAQLDWGRFRNGTFASVGFNETNEYKDIPNFTPTYTHFIWYLDFLWRYGIEWTKTSGTFLTNSYDHRQFNSYLEEQQISLHYRFRRFFNEKLRWTAKLNSISNSFITDNQDDYLLSTLLTGTGIGARFSWEIKEPQWETTSYQPFTLQQIILDLDYYPSVKVVDLQFPRGQNSNGSTIMQQKITVSVLAYLKWMYFFKRYVIDLSWGQSQANLKFSGSTNLANGDPSIVIPGGTYQENYQFVSFSIGLRMDDLVGRFLKPR